MASLSRRAFLATGGLALAGGVAAASTYLLRSDESGELVVEDMTIPLPNLPEALEGFTIAQMSDIHLWPYTTIEFVREAVAITNSLSPDLIVLTGDYVWRDLEAIHALTPILAGLNARYGVFAILGNHDLWTDAAVIEAAFARTGPPLLVNEGVSLPVGPATLYLAGVDDGWSGEPDLDAALDGAPAGAPVILLLHEPDLADATALDGRVSLQLSGHSHGGQVRLPNKGALILPYLGRKYDFGLYQINDMWLYTNRGIGATSIPIRVNCPPEISRFTLVRA
jgi:uncharacterized protein